MRIEIDREKIDNISKQLSEMSVNINKDKQNLISINSNINTFWQGVDANMLKEKITDTVIGYDNIKKVMEEYAKYLNDVNKSYDELDDYFSSLIINI